AAIRRSPSRTTKTLPCAVAASSWATPSPAAASRFRAASAMASARSVATFAPVTPPSAATTTTSFTCGEISVRSAIAWSASMAPSILAASAGRPVEVLPRSRYPPRRDDRVLRAPFVRAAVVPVARAARARTPGEPALVLRPRVGEDVPEHVGHVDPQRDPRDPGERRHARHRRRRVPALVVALVLLRARERVQHRLQPPEPRLAPRQGTGHGDDGRLARSAVRVARHRLR